jgi:CheY-like chemotaxis protein
MMDEREVVADRMLHPSAFIPYEMMKDEPIHVLLVEDDEVDVMSVRRTFARKHLSNPLHIAGNGMEALEMLRGRRADVSLPPRRVVLLDLNMPKMGGIEFLHCLRADPALRETTVVVLTTSDEERDRTDAYGMNVAGYMLKPMAAEALLDLLDRLEENESPAPALTTAGTPPPHRANHAGLRSGG